MYKYINWPLIEYQVRQTIEVDYSYQLTIAKGPLG